MGKVSTRLFWIKSGECLKREYNHEDPFNAFKFHDIVKMGPGTCFGEEGVIHSLEMPWDVIVRSELAEIYYIEKHDF